MRPWAKISEAVTEDETIADLLASNPLAVSLFLMALPACDVYGLLPGSPRGFRARVCPAADLTLKRIEGALSALEQAGLLLRFEDNGHTWALVSHYTRYQAVRWANRVGPPSARLPADWTPPEELCLFVASLPPHRQKQWREAIPALNQEQYRSATVALPQHSRSATACYRSETETETEGEGETAGRARAREGASPEAEPERLRQVQAEALAGDGHMLLANNPEVRELVARYCPNFTGPKVGGWAICLLRAIREPNTALTRDEWLAEFAADPPTSTTRFDKWVDFHESKAKAIRNKRVGQASGNGDEPDPLEAPYLKLWAETPELSVEKCPRLTERVNAWVAWIHAGGPRGSPGRKQRLEQYRQRLHALGSWKTVPELTPEQFPMPPEATADARPAAASAAQPGG